MYTYVYIYIYIYIYIYTYVYIIYIYIICIYIFAIYIYIYIYIYILDHVRIRQCRKSISSIIEEAPVKLSGLTVKWNANGSLDTGVIDR